MSANFVPAALMCVAVSLVSTATPAASLDALQTLQPFNHVAVGNSTSSSNVGARTFIGGSVNGGTYEQDGAPSSAYAGLTVAGNANDVTSRSINMNGLGVTVLGNYQGELRDTGQLFLVARNGGAPSGNIEISQGSTLTLAGPRFDVPSITFAGGNGSIRLTAGSAGNQGRWPGEDTRVVAGATLSVIGAGDAIVIPPAEYVTLGPGAQVRLTSGSGIITLAELSRHSGPYASFASRQHGSPPWHEGHHGNGGHHWNGGHHGNGEHHGNGWPQGGEGHHWNFHGNYGDCDISPAIPEPESYALMLTGLLVVWGATRRRRKVLNGDTSL